LDATELSQTKSKLLENIGEVLDLTEAQYEAVVERYTAVSNHLAREGSPLAPYKPDVKPQGSFLLGTMIRPIIEDDTLDVDLVCRLQGKKASWAQFNVKQAVKDQLISNADYERMLDEEGNRCWTLLYHESSKFHMDILPAIVHAGHFTLLEKSFNGLNTSQIEELAVRITDRRLPNYRTDIDTRNWLKSNPFGYAAWFKDRSNISIAKALLLRESVELLPEYNKNKEPLVRVVQILKRHRDIMFGTNEHKPISCIITTLAARAYNKESDLFDALGNVLENMSRFIEKRYSVKHQRDITWITNPVNIEENFADRWIEDSGRENAFYSWYDKAKADFILLRHMNFTHAYRYLKELLGSRAVNEAVKNIGYATLINEQYKPTSFKPSLLAVSHRKQPSWPQLIQYSVEVHGNYKNRLNKHTTITPSTTIPKNCYIYFTASTNVPSPFEVYWQVVNTGEEARNKNGLRGEIFLAQTRGRGGLSQKEYSNYSGLHWVECFIVKNGVCVARSTEFFVIIQ
jgi:hypothetical protein